MTEVYFGGDGCVTCGRAVRRPWNRPHADWCADVRRSQFRADMRTVTQAGHGTNLTIRHQEEFG